MSKSSKPVRLATDYTPEEILVFREKFRLAAEHFYRRFRVASYALIVFSLCMVIGLIFYGTLFPLALIGLFGAYAVSFYFTHIVPRCPGCNLKLDSDLGEFCPECGNRSLQKSEKKFASPQCSACGKVLTNLKLRHYKIRSCTYCGLKLDEKGL